LENHESALIKMTISQRFAGWLAGPNDSLVWALCGAAEAGARFDLAARVRFPVRRQFSAALTGQLRKFGLGGIQATIGLILRIGPRASRGRK
jgi:hypothetical protein